VNASLLRHLIALVVVVWSGTPTAGVSAQSVTPPVQGQPLPITVGDQLRIETWREAQYSGVYTVDAAGRVTLPQVGRWTVQGLTADSLRERLVAAWGQTLRDPVVQVTVLRRIRVLGEVTSPGLFHLDETFSVADALAMAGGRTPLAKNGVVRFRRGDTDKWVDVRSDLPLRAVDVRTGDELFVPRQGWWERNTAPMIGAIGGLLGIVAALTVR
jgi:polysaccharide biosynthesis/export protein